jgi:hypothetical protein
VPIVDRLADRTRRDLVIYRLREHLHWLNDLKTLRELSMKTWPADPRQRRGWTPEELCWVNSYYSDQAPEVSAKTRNGGIEPMELESISSEDSLGFGMTELGYSMYVLMRDSWRFAQWTVARPGADATRPARRPPPGRSRTSRCGRCRRRSR